MRQIVLADTEIRPLLTDDEISYLEHPEKYIGHAEEIADRVIKQIRTAQSSDPERIGFFS